MVLIFQKNFIIFVLKKFPDNKFYNIDILKENIDFLPKFDYIF